MLKYIGHLNGQIYQSSNCDLVEDTLEVESRIPISPQANFFRKAFPATISDYSKVPKSMLCRKDCKAPSALEMPEDKQAGECCVIAPK